MGALSGLTHQDFGLYEETVIQMILIRNFFGIGVQCAPALLLDADVIGVYYSAHWCPPCRQFTPQLAEIYAVRTP